MPQAQPERSSKAMTKSHSLPTGLNDLSKDTTRDGSHHKKVKPSDLDGPMVSSVFKLSESWPHGQRHFPLLSELSHSAQLAKSQHHVRPRLSLSPAIIVHTVAKIHAHSARLRPSLCSRGRWDMHAPPCWASNTQAGLGHPCSPCSESVSC